jgi:hypothetical protein
MPKIARNQEGTMKKSPKSAAKPAKKAPKHKKLAMSKSLVGVVTVNDISPV